MPTPVQRKALPIILSGVDACVMARTGSGKTCAFLIPLLEKLLPSSSSSMVNAAPGVRGLILSPTRELSQQTLVVLNKLTAGRSSEDIKCIGIHGGEGMEKQFSLLASRPDVIVATPGRLAHHLTEIPDFTLAHCVMCILDEADRLMEMGFAAQIRQITKSMPETCQKVLLSATMPKMLVEFTKSGFCTDPTVVRLDSEVSVSEELRISFITTRSLEKDAALLHVMQHIIEDKEAVSNSSMSQDETTSMRTGLTLIFAATRHHVEYIGTLLSAAGMNTTVIYGTLDQEARQQNLAAFRSGKKPILVVTDVAARGIDVPLIDHVIHYHFPPSPKLFVHRSGRAARAGRIGFCWCLVEPDEMPYMMDLHLFLGRRPLCVDDIENENEKSYTLSEMTPDFVHYGSLPECIATVEAENVTRIMNAELSGSLEAEALRSLTKVCKNAMMQYRRTRSEASREGVRRAKAILEGERDESGRRIGKGAIPPHPLLRSMELSIHTRKLDANANIGLDSKLESLRQRDDFLRALSNFRPKESVFEAFATGKTKDTAVVSHIDKGRTTKNKKNDSSAALTAMKNMRRQMHIARDKGTSLVVAGSADALTLNGEFEANNMVDKRGDHHTDDVAFDDHSPCDMGSGQDGSMKDVNRRRMSRVERKRLKKNQSVTSTTESDEKQTSSSFPKERNLKHGTDFRDKEFFIDNDFSSSTMEADRSRRIEAAMQPSTSSGAPRGAIKAALRLEETMMDIIGDENDDIVKKQRMMRWDKSKRKYVQTTVGEELSGESKSKKLRTESGQILKSNKVRLGELYQKWQKKTNRSIGRTGVFDDVDCPIDSQPSPKEKISGKVQRKKESRDKCKSAVDIKKEREKKQNVRMKNMKKGDRRHAEQKHGASGGKSLVSRGFKKR
jgi:ATP-dependent RNA helicase DDX54/DBP10